MKATKIFAAGSGILLACLMLVSQAAYAGVAGYAQFVNGSVQIESLAGQMHTLQKGGAVNEGDTVISAPAASAQIRMQDGGFIAVRPDTRLKFDRFIFSGKDDGSERSFFSLFKGGFRAVTGLIGRLNKSNYRITTASSTIGIRGTDHETFVVTPDSPLARVTPVGTYNKVNVGETSITTDKGTVFVLPNQMGFAGAKNQMPELKPLNTNIFTAVDRPTKEAKVDKKEAREEAKEVRVIATVDNTAQAVAAAPAAEVASSSTGSGVATNILQPITTTNGTDLSGGGPSYAAQAQAAADAANLAKLAAVAAELSAAAADTQLAALTLVDTAPATTAIGTATTNIAAANTAVTAASTLAPVVTTAATTAIGTATTNIGTASTVVTALVPANATTAADNATAALTAATAATSQASVAQSAFTANGTFADTTAGPANTATQYANGLLQTANTAVQSAAGIVTTQNAALTTAQSAATAALGTANTSINAASTNLAIADTQNAAIANAKSAAIAALGTANTSLITASTSRDTAITQNAAIVTAQGSVATQLTAAQTAAANAQTAATAAQTAAVLAASLQQAGDLAGAQAQLMIAQQQLAIAQTEQTNAQVAKSAVAAQLASAQAAQAAAGAAASVAVSAATAAASASTQASNQAAAAQTAVGAANTAVNTATTNANTAATYATTANTQATAASAAATAANNALTTTTTQLVVVNTNAATVSTNAPIAAYNNPAVASSNFTGHLAMPAPGATSGYNIAHEQNSMQQANTQFVLDGSGNLVEMRNTSFQIQPMQTPTTPIANADVKWTGGTAADTFKLADNSIYVGRWSGATVTVTDQATSAPIPQFTLTPADSLWAVLLTPNSGYVQTLTGTTSYTMAGATTPFDAAGNLGTLNSATLSANFINQTVDATVNLTMPSGLMAGTYAVTATNMPINTALSGDSSGFGGNSTPTVSCSGGTGTCAGGGYSADVGGSFAGTAAASVGLGYDIWPTVTAGPVTDLVQGLVAFSAATPPTVLTGGPFTPYASNYIAVETAGGLNFNSGMMAAPADLVYVTGGTGNASTSGALQSMTFHDLGGGGNWMQTSAITPGAATSADAPAFTTTGIQYGVWTGYTGQSNTWSQSLGGKNGGAPDSWMYGPEGYVDASNGLLFSGTSAGTFTYQLDGATAPKSQNTGLTGVLNSATLTVNFASMMLTANMSLTMPGNENWGAATPVGGISIGSGALNVNPVVTYGVGVPATPCATCSGNVRGMFTGQNFAGAILSYNLYNNATMGGGDVSGNVALTRVGTTVINGAPAPTGNIVVATAGNGSGSSSVSTYPVGNSITTGNLLTAYGSSGTGYSNSTTVTCTTCTTNPSGQVATSGIYYGTWDAGTYAQTFNSTFTAGMMTPSYWITGPEAGPLYLPQALTGTATYAFNAGQVSNSMGTTGTVAGTTALTLDFNKQTVGINLDVSIADTATTPVVHIWNATTLPGNEAVLGNGQGINGAAFSASTYNNGGGSGLLTVSVDGLTANVTNPSGNINGQLTGTGLTGAIMSFNLNGVLNPLATATYENINGVAAFTGTAQSVATPHQYVLMSLADPISPVPLPVLGFNANAVSTTLPVGVKTDGSGNLTQFDIQTINGGGGSSTVANVNAANADHGTDATSGISWGRWAGGSFTVTDRQTTAAKTVTQTAGNSLHWITEPVSTSAVTLPTSGTYTYTNAGGTLPTDNLGNVGTLNSATLAANFTAQTVNVGVNATVAGATLNAAGTSVPIIQNTVFYASSLEPATSTSYLTVGCTGTPCGATGGVVIGKFTGAGAIGAAVSYGLQNGATTISGVTAFHR